MRHLYRLRYLSLLIVLLASLVVVASPAHSANAVVTDCTNFTGPGTISAALATANVGGGIITFTCSGTIVFTSALSPSTSAITIDGTGQSVVFSGGGTTRHFSLSSANLTLINLTLTNGSVTGFGGSINQTGGTLNINNVTFTNNTSTQNGSAIMLSLSSANTITNSTFSNNTSPAGLGTIGNGTPLTITGTTFSNNLGGYAIFNGGTVTVNNSQFIQNAQGIYQGGTSFSVQNTFFDGNGSNNQCTFVGTPITNLGGNTRVNSTGCPGTVIVNLAVNPLSCSGNNMVVNITAGDPNFNITGTGPNLPRNNVAVSSQTFTGPGIWSNVTVTELTGNLQSTNLGGIVCGIPTITTCDFATLQAVVANANVTGGVINFGCSGTINFTSMLTINNNITINENGNNVIFDGGDTVNHFTVSAGRSLTLNDFTLQNGRGVQAGSIQNFGTLTVNNATFTGNDSTDYGGAIFNAIPATATFSNTAFTNNSAVNGGGAILNRGNLTINSGSTFSNNTALGISQGGAIFNSANPSAIANIDATTFTSNNGGAAGAIFYGASSSMTITNSTFNTNHATNDYGGALAGDGTLSVTGSGFTGNTAITSGGAIHKGTVTGTITNNTFSNNTATTGGAIADYATSNVTGSTFTNNTCFGTLNNLGGNVANTALGCPGEALTVAPLSCVGNDMIVNITVGDANFNITGTGPNLPLNNVGIASHTITGPGSWTGVTVTELDGDAQSTNLGNITCGPVTITINTCDFATLQAAVTSANVNGGTINFACSGTINFPAELFITNNVTINENGQNVVFNGGGITRHFYVNGGALTLNDFTLQNGSAGDGGSIYNAGTFIANNITFTNNTAFRGGAIHTALGAATTVNTSTFSGNNGGYGGAIHSYGTTDVNGGTFSGNGGGGTVAGGAIYNEIGTLNISGGTPFTSNQAEYGGAVYAYLGTTTINGASFTNNIATTDITTGAIENGGGSIGSQNVTYTNNTCGGASPITDNGGNIKDMLSTGCPGIIALAVDPLTCSGNDMVVNITAGDANFNITGTGPNLPTNNVGIASHTITGPGSWTGVTVTELTGDLQSTNLGDITCGPVTITINTCDFATLQAAVTSANINGGTINFACSGTINFTSELIITNNITINENGQNVVFDGGGITRHFNVYSGASLTLNNFTLQHGNPGVNFGGSIFNDGVLNLNNNLFDSNTADIFGAIFNNANMTSNGNMFTNNTAITYGGAIGNSSIGTINLTNDTFDGNSAPADGAITNSGLATLNNVNFTNNTVTGITGAVYNDGNMTIIGGSFVNNIATSAGAINNFGGGTLSSQNVTYTGNNCIGTITNNGGNTRDTASAGCPGITDLITSAVCVGSDLHVTITDGDGTFDISASTGVGVPQLNVGTGTIILTGGSGDWTNVQVTEDGGDGQVDSLGNFDCLTPLITSVGCVGNDLTINIVGGDGPFNVTGTGNGLPLNNVVANLYTLSGPDAWTNVTIAETTGDLEFTTPADFNCYTPVALSASAVCVGNALQVTIFGGNGNYDITSTTGTGLPLNNVIADVYTLTGPAAWTGVTVTELSGDLESTNLGNFTCQIPLAAIVVCDPNGDLAVSIGGGDANFTITGTGFGLPIASSGTGSFTINADALGVNSWTGVTITEIGFNNESILFGDFNCNVPLVATAVCNGVNLEVTTTSGDVAFNITDGATNYALGAGLGMTSLVGPIVTTNLTVTETGGDAQSINLGAFNCSNTLTANATCDANGDLTVNITSGDPNFNITGTGVGLPLNGVAGGIHTLNDDLLGVNSWTGVTVTEAGPDFETILLGDFNCAVPLAVTAVCNGVNLDVTTTGGDVSFDVTSDSGYLGTVTGLATLTFTGPLVETNVSVTETSGDGQSINLGNFNCSNTLVGAYNCSANGDLEINLTSADLPVDVGGTGLGLPTTITALGITTIAGNVMGPNSWTGVTLTETTGNLEGTVPQDLNCNKPVDVTAVCIGADLHVTVNAADVSVDLTDGATNIQTGVGFGTLIIPGPINVANLTATETGGDNQIILLGAYNCFISNALTATATCNGNDLQITVSNGNAPFTINVTDGVGVMSLTGQPLGVYPFIGPDTFSNISIVEEGGDLEVVNIASVTCPPPVPVVPVAPVSLAPDPNALGCELTNTVDMPNASDNTYCRVLMRDGAVVGYSGAIPQQLVNLGVIFAVDVYQLRGGQAVNEFVGYQQICLSGTGRLFYMDSRQSPRSIIELQTESINGMTCGWIPAPGTLILTNQ